jgi:hypothetical protein
MGGEPHVIVRVSRTTLDLDALVVRWKVVGVVEDGRVMWSQMPARLNEILDDAVRVFESVVALDIAERFPGVDVVVEAVHDGIDEVSVNPSDAAVVRRVAAFRDQHITAWVAELHESYADVEFNGKRFLLTYPPGRYVVAKHGGWTGRFGRIPVVQPSRPLPDDMLRRDSKLP